MSRRVSYVCDLCQNEMAALGLFELHIRERRGSVVRLAQFKGSDQPPDICGDCLAKMLLALGLEIRQEDDALSLQRIGADEKPQSTGALGSER